MGFEGKVALITGSGKGIGRAIAGRFVDEGAAVCINDIDLDAAEETRRDLEKRGGKVLVTPADISKEDEVSRMFERILDRFGAPDILINNAGIGNALMVEDMPYEVWKETIDINLNGVFLCCKAALGPMQSKRYGKIVNIASVAAKKISYHGGAHYTAAKAGVLGFTRQLAFELAPFGINVNAVCPGATLTPLLCANTTEAERQAELSRFPLGRFCEVEDIADVVLFLCSEGSKMMTGQAIDVDAGELLAWTDYETYRKYRKDYADRFFARR